MQISFKSNKLKKQLTYPKNLLKSYGQMAKKINQRIKDLEAAENLAVMRTIPAARCHELTEGRKDEFAVDVSKNYRLIFMADHEPIPIKEDGGKDWDQITHIKIIEIDDYH